MMKKGALVIVPEPESEFTLENLPADITEENTPGEWDAGSAEGKEIWQPLRRMSSGARNTSVRCPRKR